MTKKINYTWGLVNNARVVLLVGDIGLALGIWGRFLKHTFALRSSMETKPGPEFKISKDNVSELLKTSVETSRRDLKATDILLLGRKRSRPTGECTNDELRKKRSKKNSACVPASIAFQVEPSAVARRNERERNRVRMVNDGFSCLRQHIPYFPDKKKLSKVETLRCAVAYIKHLQDLITEHDSMCAESVENTENTCKNVAAWVAGQS